MYVACNAYPWRFQCRISHSTDFSAIIQSSQSPFGLLRTLLIIYVL